jgi:hypothetical protein
MALLFFLTRKHFGISLPQLLLLLLVLFVWTSQQVQSLSLSSSSSSLSSSSRPKNHRPWRVDHHNDHDQGMQQPPPPQLCRVVQAMVGLGTRMALGIQHSEELSVQVKATSNRAVLQGQLQQLTVTVRKSSGPFLQLDQLDVHGSNLDLGGWPLVSTVVLPLCLVLRPVRTTTAMLLLVLWHTVRRRSAVSSSSSSSSSPFPSILSWFQQQLNGKQPCHWNYGMVISEDNVAYSSLIQLGLRAVLRSLMIHSVLGVAASAMDTIQQLRTTTNTKAKNNNNNNNNKRSQASSWLSLLSPQQQSSQLRLGPSGSSPDMELPYTNSVGNQPPPQQPQPMLAKLLLEATSFELTRTSFVQNHVIFDAEAVFPTTTNKDQLQDDGASILVVEEEQGRLSPRLSYTLRTTPQVIFTTPTNTATATSNNNYTPQQQPQQPQPALALVSPECRFSLEGISSTTRFPGGAAAASFLERFLPDAIWVPVGPGVAMPIPMGGAGRHVITEWSATQGVCRLSGQVRLNSSIVPDKSRGKMTPTVWRMETKQ